VGRRRLFLGAPHLFALLDTPSQVLQGIVLVQRRGTALDLG
jgi:hypothetical protein